MTIFKNIGLYVQHFPIGDKSLRDSVNFQYVRMRTYVSYSAYLVLYSRMSWQECRAGCRWFLMFLTTFSWSNLLKLSVDVATHPPVPNAKGSTLWPIRGHATDQKHLIHAQGHDRGQTTSKRHSAAAAVTGNTGGQNVLLLEGGWPHPQKISANFIMEKWSKTSKIDLDQHGALVNLCYFECSSVLTNTHNCELV